MARTTVFAIVEGHSENGFLNRFLASHLGMLGIDFIPKIIGEGGSKGGMKFRSFKQTYEEIARFLRDRRKPYVTTFLDYYGLPTGKDWEFVTLAKAHGAQKGVILIEQEFASNVRASVQRSDLAERFIPYLQLHELEALFFSDPFKLAETLGQMSLAIQFEKIVTECGECEMINDHPQTAPSKRLQKLFPAYIKGRSDTAHSPRIGNNLELTKVRKVCPRFNSWLTSLEKLASESVVS